MFKTIIVAALSAQIALSAVLPSLDRRQAPNNLTQEYQAYIQQFNAGALVENVFNATFFQTPGNFSTDLKPGQVLKLDMVSNTTLSAQYGYPAGMTLWRLMYTSLDVRNKTVPATAFVLSPYESTKRTIAWTHGTSGITRDCAPSNWRSLYYDFDGPFTLALQGYNVIGTDYAGQGSDARFDYVAGASHASDASYSIVAARKALPHLKIDEWAVVGHSEGGLSAWTTTERESISPTGGFLGGISIAPSMDPVEINLRAFATSETRAALTASGSVFYPVFLLEVIRRLFPTLQLSDYLTELGLDILNLNLQGGCYPGAAQYFPTFTLEQVWKDYSWLNSTQANDWRILTADRGEGRLNKPLLVIQGTADEAVSYPVNKDTFDAHCEKFGNDSPIQFVEYPDFMHGPVIQASIQQRTTFLNDLFEHQKPSNFGNCKTVVNQNLKASRAENYAVNFAGRA